MTPVRLEPAALRSRVKRSTTEPLRSLKGVVIAAIMFRDFVTITGFLLELSVSFLARESSRT